MENLEVYISCVNGHFSAAIKGFHKFQIGNNQISELLADLPQAIDNHTQLCRMKKYNYPDELKRPHQILCKYSIYAALFLMPDISLLSKETKIQDQSLKGYMAYIRKPKGLIFKRIFDGINRIGERISALEKPDFLLCSNENLIAEYSGMSVTDIQAYKSGKVMPKAETQEKLLTAMHQIGKLYQSLVWG